MNGENATAEEERKQDEEDVKEIHVSFAKLSSSSTQDEVPKRVQMTQNSVKLFKGYLHVTERENSKMF